MWMYAVGACVEATKCNTGCSVDVKNCGVEVKKSDVFLLLVVLFRLCHHLLDNFKAKEHDWRQAHRDEVYFESKSLTAKCGTMWWACIVVDPRVRFSPFLIMWSTK